MENDPAVIQVQIVPDNARISAALQFSLCI